MDVSKVNSVATVESFVTGIASLLFYCIREFRIYGRAVEMPWQVKELATKSANPSLTPRSTWWKERTHSFRLSVDPPHASHP